MNRLHQLIWAGLVTAVLAIVGIALFAEFRRTELPVLSQFRPFVLTNQLGQVVTPETLRGQVVVANVIFSRCPTQCHQLSRQMGRLQEKIGSGTRLISLTADPMFDSPEVLKQYGQRYGTDPSRWWFLTGPKAEVYRVAEKDLLFSVMDTGEANPRLEDRFIHSGTFVLMDRQGRMRAVVQGEEPDAERRILNLARQLERETNL